jgi:hypothetical protein
MMKVPINLPYSSVQASKLQKQRDLARERDTHTQAKGLQINGSQLQAANMKSKDVEEEVTPHGHLWSARSKIYTAALCQ